MNDRLPGSSWSNPIWYGRWRIYVSDNVEIHGYPYEYVHDDYDGSPDADDNRYGLAQSVDECKAEIDSYEEWHR